MIDFHTHPMLVREMIAKYPELETAARKVFFIQNILQPLETFFLELDISGLERAVLLPIDATSTRGCCLYTNEQIAELCALSDRFVGFASVDPHDSAAPEKLRRAVEQLGLRGLKLAPPMQEFYPDDRTLAYPLYEVAQELRIPVVLHAGMSWEPGSRAKYGHPMHLEDVAADFPQLNIVIAHFAWPWVLEAVMLALKYPNVYIDTSCLYFDNPTDFMRFVIGGQVPVSLIEKSLRNQIVFGSNYPRVEIKNMARAVRSVGLSEGCLDLIFRDNARHLLGEV
nr:amidohydrolase [Chloroflexota bacterium]